MECLPIQIFTTNWPMEKENIPTKYSTDSIDILPLDQTTAMTPILELFLHQLILSMATFGVREAGNCLLSNQEKEVQVPGEGGVEGEEE